METENQNQNIIQLEFGDVREKKIKTPNDFVSHMIEHISWRLGTKIELSWNNENWQELGKKLGEEIRRFKPVKRQAAALGMIDDGTAEVVVDLDDNRFEITSSQAVDLEWFLAQRCEQFDSAGKPLTDLLTGLAEGLKGRIEVKVGNIQDQHHTWEGIYRAVGIALSKIFTPVELAQSANARLVIDNEMEENCSQGDISVLKRSANYAEVRRGTAETGVTVGVDFNDEKVNQWDINVAESIRGAVTKIEDLFGLFTKEAGIKLIVNFESKVLSSSHVVFEDIGLVLGRALKEI
jgi:imidazoleglycerol phosphate dehydratase HisB